VYASGTIALATLEIIVHLESTAPLPAYRLIEMSIPESLVTALQLNSLPANWRQYPAPAELRVLGDEWLDTRRSAVLKVPSALVAIEYNYVINPHHPDFGLITTGSPLPFPLDPRLL
jgi:RES domain-containing protein